MVSNHQNTLYHERIQSVVQLLTWSRFLQSGVYKRSPPFDLGCFRCGDGRYLSANNTEARLWKIFVNAIGFSWIR